MSYGQRIFSIVPDSVATPQLQAAKVDALGPAPPPGLTDRRHRRLRDLRISVIDQCNFRCTYCMPKEVFGRDYQFLPKSSLLSFDEIETLARVFVSVGVEKLRITGGEPLLRKSLEDLIARLAALQTPSGQPVEIAMTTNGVLLKEKAALLKKAGLHRVTVSLDTLNDDVFRRMNDADYPVNAVLAGIDAATSAGLTVKINMVVQRGVNDQEVLPMAAAFRERGLTLRFIEYMDVGSSNAWQLDQVVPAREIVETISHQFPLTLIGRELPSEVSEQWQYADGHGKIGIISSVTKPFCGNCSRARISAEGVLYTCLFATSGTDLRSLLRQPDFPTDAAIANAIAHVWTQRDDRYSELRHQHPKDGKKVEMSYIGG